MFWHRIISIFFLLVTNFGIAENYPNLTNTWLSFQARKSVSQNFDLSLDGGLRLNTNFIQNVSQGLGRVIIRRKMGDHFFLGGGNAFFAHFSNVGNTLENRPFLQVNYETNLGKSFHKFRLRNEWRDFTNRKDVFRIRMQYYLKRAWRNSDKLHTVFSAEQFYTFNQNGQPETRIICGLEQKINNSCSIQYAYILRNQYTKNGIGHILQINLLFF
jgi:hypothetical protein